MIATFFRGTLVVALLAAIIAALVSKFPNAVQIESQQTKSVLTIYTYDAFAAEWGPAPGIEAAFEETCNCDIQFIAADSSIGALRKIQLEGSQTPADILLGLDTNIAEAARETGLFIEHGADTSTCLLYTSPSPRD